MSHCKNVKECSCPKTTCQNHGRCCACVIKHKTTDSLPFCLFPNSNGNKSNRNYYETLKKRFESDNKKENQTMKIEIYEKALCCETGVCGTEVDTELLRITSLVAELKAKGVDIEKANLSTRPERFIQNALVSGLIREHGVEILPLTIIDGKVVKQKSYPANAEIEAWTGVKLGSGKQGGSQNGGCGCGKKGCC